MRSEHDQLLRRGIDLVLTRSRPWRHANSSWPLAVACGLLWSCFAVAHSDLAHQIEDLDQQIAADPGVPELYLARGNLHRRQQHWDAAAADYERVRALAPDDPTIDWYEGHLWLDAEQPHRAEALLSRYAAQRPGFAPVLHLRARARMSQQHFDAAAADYGAAVMASARPGPSLFRDWSLALAADGQWPQAMLAAQAGLAALPGEVALSGLAADLALVNGHQDVARALLEQQAEPIAALPQWRYRAGMLACLEGRAADAETVFGSLSDLGLASEARPAGTWSVDPEALADLASDATADQCRAVLREQLLPPG